MNCYLCNQSAQYLCNSSIPNILICHKTYIEDKSNKHTLEFLENTNEINLWISLLFSLRIRRKSWYRKIDLLISCIKKNQKYGYIY